MSKKLLDESGLTKAFSIIKSALAGKQDKITSPLSTGLGGTGNNTGTAALATTTADTSNTLYVVGVTNSATTTLKRDTSVNVKGGTITATTFKGDLDGNAKTATTATSAGSCSGNASTATTATQLSTNAGSSAKPVYFTGGIPSALTVTAGSDNANAIGLMYINSGEVKLITANSGTATKPVFVEGGVIKPGTYELKSTVNEGTANKLAYYSGNKAISSYTGSKGDSNKICYLKNGVPTDGIRISYGSNLPSSGMSTGDIFIKI